MVSKLISQPDTIRSMRKTKHIAFAEGAACIMIKNVFIPR